MKLSAIFEKSSYNTVSVAYDLERQLPDGEWEVVPVRVSGVVHTERDPFGTGDSPTEHTFEPRSVEVAETGQQIDVDAFYKMISQSAAEWIEDQAIESSY